MGTLRVKDAFAVSDSDGVQRVYAGGELVDDKDPVIKGREHHFETVEVTVGRRARRARRATVEEATAVPGEKRDMTEPEEKPAKKTAAKKASDQ